MPATRSTVPRDPSPAAVWAPWLAAPLFALLPVAGCGLAGLAPAAAHQPAAGAAPVVSVMPVVTADARNVAWAAAAH